MRLLHDTGRYGTVPYQTTYDTVYHTSDITGAGSASQLVETTISDSMKAIIQMRNGGNLFCLEVGRTGIGRNRNAKIGRNRLHYRGHHLESRIVLARITDSVEFRSFSHVIRSFPTVQQVKQYTKK